MGHKVRIDLELIVIKKNMATKIFIVSFEKDFKTIYEVYCLISWNILISNLLPILDISG